ncbi:AmpG family muropeptide MFS transporter [Polynucleobacter victoriensis]|uniref:MFS transporter, PAT family, beta-lactamase induction signal transducer AmpG n=1 Tax=Polynucleobacter victoriensis TaxID=2049319 RepID=A0A212TCU7_9BURK|nr:AmpG family muropeptide MFS transporter [Polynucleobacter victoriensis]SNC63849.1 MFS transporter, PAT family, beta-lactamase induction signal transducer AmpG [Polynucleobacter victoriensis]
MQSIEHVGPSKTKALLVCVFLGFSSGLPLFILYNLLSAWLKSEGVDLKAIGLFALVGMPYTWKFLWAPAMDRFNLPFLGRRRGWMIATQVAVMIAVILMGQFNPRTEIWTVVFLASIVSFLSASQDVVVDAHRREWLTEEQMGSGTALFVNAYKLSTLVPGSLSLILSDLMTWDWVFLITGLFMLPGILTTLLVSEPKMYGPAPKTLKEAVIEPFNEFMQRRGWQHAVLVLAFIFLYKLGDSMATALATPFYIELGFTRTEIGLVAKNAGLWASILGGILGAYWMLKTGVNKALWLFGFLQAIAIIGFAILAQTGADLWVLTWVIGFEALSVGLGTAAFTSYIALETNPRFTATQFALFTSLSAVPRTFINALTGYIVELTGWTNFFVICFILAIPGLLLLPKIAPWNKEKQSGFEKAA